MMRITPEEIARAKEYYGPGGKFYDPIKADLVAEIERLQAENDIIKRPCEDETCPCCERWARATTMSDRVANDNNFALRKECDAKDAEIARLKARDHAMAEALWDLWIRHNGGDVVTPAGHCPCSTCKFIEKLLDKNPDLSGAPWR